MTDRRRGLGRGLGALIPSARTAEGRPVPVTQETPLGSDTQLAGEQVDPGASGVNGGDDDGLLDSGASFAELAVHLIAPNARQPREVFDEDAHDELVRSIREVGILQPVVVRRIPGPGEARYELVMGERRWRAAQAAGLPRIPAIIRQTADDAMLRDALLENLHRSQLNPLEEAAAFDQLLRDFGCTQDELAERVGRSRPQVSNTIRLLKLPPSVQRRLAAGVLSAGHARALLSLADAATQERLAQRIVAEGLSVRSVEEIVAVGEAAGAKSRPRPRRPVAPALADLAIRLSERFETRVKVDLGTRRGRITVEFGSIDDLERIVEMMDPAVVRPAPEIAVASVRPGTEAPFTSAAPGSPEPFGQPHPEAGHWAHVSPADDAVDAGFAEGSGADEHNPPRDDTSR